MARDEEIGSIKRPRTIESTREPDPTRAHDEEVAGDEQDDEFANERPKILITTRPRPSRELFRFIRDLLAMVPNASFYARRQFSVQQITSFASNRKFTHLVVLGEKAKKCNSMLLTHLPAGPTAFFKVSAVTASTDVPDAGRKTHHVPEILLNNFTTRLGRRLGRFLGSLFTTDVDFRGRQAVTFHNQRDYIFVRHHRYIFDDKPTGTKARLQELGPRFTLRLRWLQDGLFDPAHGEFEWFHRRKQMDTSRRKFHL